MMNGVVQWKAADMVLVKSRLSAAWLQADLRGFSWHACGSFSPRVGPPQARVEEISVDYSWRRPLS